VPDPDFTFAGEWVTATEYAVDDVVYRYGNAYQALDAHTSAADGPPSTKWKLVSYATVDRYRGHVDRNTTAGDDLILAQLMTATHWWAQRRRRPDGFGRVGSAAARTFYVHRAPEGCGARKLWVDDIADSAGLTVAINGETVDASLYELWPLNAPQGIEAEPYEQIVRTGSARWPLGEPIVVTAVWGWPAVPAAIREATVEWTAIWRNESPGATQHVQEIDQVAAFSPYHASQLKRMTQMYAAARRPVSGVGPG
jgi:hypothetical protein